MRTIAAALLALIVILPALALETGDKAPAIKVVGTDGKSHSLTDAIGKSWTIIAWYPKAMTSGCTRECKILSEQSKRLAGYNVVLYGASVDSALDNKKFSDMNGYNFVLLSDPGKKLASAMGVLSPMGFASRWTYIIDPKGVVQYVDRNVNPETAADDLIKHLDALKVPKK